jgi:hypothetical protein
MIDRRTFLTCTGAVLLAAPLAAEGQQQIDKVHKIGLLPAGFTPAERRQEAAKGKRPFQALSTGRTEALVSALGCRIRQDSSSN